MLLVGPPNRNELWRQYVADRDAGSTEMLPIYEQRRDGPIRRRPGADLAAPGDRVGHARVAYLQHPSDPIVWWAPR